MEGVALETEIWNYHRLCGQYQCSRADLASWWRQLTLIRLTAEAILAMVEAANMSWQRSTVDARRLVLRSRKIIFRFGLAAMHDHGACRCLCSSEVSTLYLRKLHACTKCRLFMRAPDCSFSF